MEAKTERFEMRMSPTLRAWFKTYAQEQGMAEAQVIHALLEALAEGRMTVTPRPGPRAFPREELVVDPVPGGRRHNP